eukprot:1150651-Pelagomonas_calceolata.AAC.2
MEGRGGTPFGKSLPAFSGPAETLRAQSSDAGTIIRTGSASSIHSGHLKQPPLASCAHNSEALPATDAGTEACFFRAGSCSSALLPLLSLILLPLLLPPLITHPLLWEQEQGPCYGNARTPASRAWTSPPCLEPCLLHTINIHRMVLNQQVPVILLQPAKPGTCYSHIMFYTLHFLKIHFCLSPGPFSSLNAGQNGRCATSGLIAYFIMISSLQNPVF